MTKQNRTVLIVLGAVLVLGVALAGLQIDTNAAANQATEDPTRAIAQADGCPLTPAEARTDISDQSRPNAEECTGDCDNCVTGETEREKPYVDADKCISCTRCTRVAPEAFEMNRETKKAQVKEDAPADMVERGAKACPVDAVVR